MCDVRCLCGVWVSGTVRGHCPFGMYTLTSKLKICELSQAVRLAFLGGVVRGICEVVDKRTKVVDKFKNVGDKSEKRLINFI
ncbi:hypothetical protein [Neobacillus jeddahensis]|uniref:hypothetical protein n=1 Tax=Neobacillus jeddahensis TaxID=1461580 RepID=UPI0011DD158F|nr:hypothetical protein [Neobacillus jeddahensis]